MRMTVAVPFTSFTIPPSAPEPVAEAWRELTRIGILKQPMGPATGWRSRSQSTARNGRRRSQRPQTSSQRSTTWRSHRRGWPSRRLYPQRQG